MRTLLSAKPHRTDEPCRYLVAAVGTVEMLIMNALVPCRPFKIVVSNEDESSISRWDCRGKNMNLENTIIRVNKEVPSSTWMLILHAREDAVPWSPRRLLHRTEKVLLVLFCLVSRPAVIVSTVSMRYFLWRREGGRENILYSVPA